MYKTLISASQLSSQLGASDLVIIDTRFSLNDTNFGRNAYAEGHIPGAQYAHLDEDLSGEIRPGKTGRHPFPSVEKISKKLSGWGIDNDTQVVVYDQQHGGIAARLWFLLKWLGHEKVAVLDGGWANWVAKEYPVIKDLPEVVEKTFTPNAQPDKLVDVAFMEENLGNSDYIYFDSRAAERYRGEVEPIDPVAGHIPGAISAPFTDNLNAEGLFKSKEELAVRFLDLLKGRPKGRAVFYCGSGVTACHNLLAMEHIGLTSPQLYPGSWSEWIINTDRPVATDG